MSAQLIRGPEPLISVITPVYNTASFLDEALYSISTQTLGDIEILVVDDGSPDNSYQIAQHHAGRDSRIRLARQRNAGVSAALNLGLTLARAPWVALQGSDDVSLPPRLERQLAFLQGNPDVKALGTWGWRIGSKGRELGTIDIGPRSREQFAALRSDHEVIFLAAPSVVLSRATALELGGFRSWAGVSEDIDLWSRIADTHTVLALPERLFKYRVHARSQSTTRFIQQMEDTMRVHENTIRRRQSRAEVDSATFHAMLAADPLHVRLRRLLTWRSQHSYRIAGGLLADRRPVGMLWLALSFVLWPQLPASRLRRQLLPWLRSRRGTVEHDQPYTPSGGGR